MGVLFCSANTPAEAGSPTLLKDIFPGTESSFAEQFTLFNGQLLSRE